MKIKIKKTDIEKMSLRQAAKHYNCNTATIRKFCTENNIKLTSKRGRPRKILTLITD